MRFGYWVLLAAAIFVLGMSLGLMLPVVVGNYLSGDISALQNLAATLGPFKLTTALFIFLKNVTSVVVSFIFAPLLLLFPLTVLSLNGALLSYVAMLAAQQRGIDFVLGAILPHGVIELPAIIIGEAAALSFGVSVILALFLAHRRPSLGNDILQQLKVLTFACALLLPAALMEAFITPLLVIG